MFNVLLFVHFVIAILLVTVILLQQNSIDGLSGIGGGNTGGGLMTESTASKFLSRLTVTLIVLFFINVLVLANMAIPKKINIQNENTDNISTENKADSEALPIAN